MGLVASDLRDDMISDLSVITGLSGADDALDILEATISNYIMNNAVVSFAWNGVQAATPYGSENTTPKGVIESLSISLTPAMSTPEQGQTHALSHLSTEIMAGVSTSTYNITDSGYSTTALPLSSAPTISSLTMFEINWVNPPLYALTPGGAFTLPNIWAI